MEVENGMDKTGEEKVFDFDHEPDVPKIKKRKKKQQAVAGTSKKKSKLQCLHCDFVCDSETRLIQHSHKHDNSRVSCGICGINFKWKANLTTHMKLHTGEGLHNCTECGKKCISKSDLERHMDLHGDEKKYQCEHCDKAFKHKQNFNQHMKIHSGVGLHQCETCGKNFISSSRLSKHQYSHSPMPLFTCVICGQGFRNKQQMGYHMRLHTNEKVHTCEHCGKVFPLPSKLSKHMQTHSLFPQFECADCGKKYKHERALMRHRQVEHDGSKTFDCPQCGKKFPSPSTLKYHMDSHSQEATYSCDICGEKFVRSRSLTYHKKLHSGEGILKCKVCDKVFFNPSGLKSHMDSHSDGQKYKCHICQRTYKHKRALDRHLVDHKGGNSFLCVVCGQQYRSHSTLVQHLRLHTGEGLYKCGVCKKIFKSKSELSRHIDSHSTVARYECDICGKKYRHRYDLAAHHKVHSKDAFICDHCDKHFATKQQLRCHMVAHTTNAPFECSKCGKCFKYEYSYRKHSRLHLDPTTSRKFTFKKHRGWTKTTTKPEVNVVADPYASMIVRRRRSSGSSESEEDELANAPDTPVVNGDGVINIAPNKKISENRWMKVVHGVIEDGEDMERARNRALITPDGRSKLARFRKVLEVKDYRESLAGPSVEDDNDDEIFDYQPEKSLERGGESKLSKFRKILQGESPQKHTGNKRKIATARSTSPALKQEQKAPMRKEVKRKSTMQKSRGDSDVEVFDISYDGAVLGTVHSLDPDDADDEPVMRQRSPPKKAKGLKNVVETVSPRNLGKMKGGRITVSTTRGRRDVKPPKRFIEESLGGYSLTPGSAFQKGKQFVPAKIGPRCVSKRVPQVKLVNIMYVLRDIMRREAGAHFQGVKQALPKSKLVTGQIGLSGKTKGSIQRVSAQGAVKKVATAKKLVSNKPAPKKSTAKKAIVGKKGPAVKKSSTVKASSAKKSTMGGSGKKDSNKTSAPLKKPVALTAIKEKSAVPITNKKAGAKSMKKAATVDVKKSLKAAKTQHKGHMVTKARLASKSFLMRIKPKQTAKFTKKSLLSKGKGSDKKKQAKKNVQGSKKTITGKTVSKKPKSKAVKSTGAGKAALKGKVKPGPKKAPPSKSSLKKIGPSKTAGKKFVKKSIPQKAAAKKSAIAKKTVVKSSAKKVLNAVGSKKGAAKLKPPLVKKSMSAKSNGSRQGMTLGKGTQKPGKSSLLSVKGSAKKHTGIKGMATPKMSDSKGQSKGSASSKQISGSKQIGVTVGQIRSIEVQSSVTSCDGSTDEHVVLVHVGADHDLHSPEDESSSPPKPDSAAFIHSLQLRHVSDVFRPKEQQGSKSQDIAPVGGSSGSIGKGSVEESDKSTFVPSVALNAEVAASVHNDEGVVDTTSPPSDLVQAAEQNIQVETECISKQVDTLSKPDITEVGLKSIPVELGSDESPPKDSSESAEKDMAPETNKPASDGTSSSYTNTFHKLVYEMEVQGHTPSLMELEGKSTDISSDQLAGSSGESPVKVVSNVDINKILAGAKQLIKKVAVPKSQIGASAHEADAENICIRKSWGDELGQKDHRIPDSVPKLTESMEVDAQQSEDNAAQQEVAQQMIEVSDGQCTVPPELVGRKSEQPGAEITVVEENVPMECSTAEVGKDTPADHGVEPMTTAPDTEAVGS